jgi:1-acyl-sn-glycerol-3-phosphate acyltransferase
MIQKITQQDVDKELIALVAQQLIETNVPHKSHIQLTDSLQQHLGMDSLGRAELFRRIEKKFQVTLPDQLLAQAETLQDIAGYLTSAHPQLNSFTPSAPVLLQQDFPRVEVSDAKTLLAVLMRYVAIAPQKPHIYFQREEGGEEVITYGQLYHEALRVASSLRELGLREGETVAIMQPTHPHFFYVFFGTLLAGAIPVPIYPPFRMHMLETYAKTEAGILNNAGVRILIAFKEVATLGHVLQAFVPSLKHVVTPDMLLQAEGIAQPDEGEASDFALIQYTSGSTSDPKGVLLSHANLLANIRAYGKAIQVRPDDVAVSWLPLYHDMGLIGAWFGSLYHGVPLILMTPFSFLNHPERWLWMIHYHRGTLSSAPNFAYDLCVRKIDPDVITGLDLSSWRMAANGAEKIYPKTLDAFAEKFAPFGFKKTAITPAYGLAESTVALSIFPLEQTYRVDTVDRVAFEEKQIAEAHAQQGKRTLDFVSCGVPITGHDIRIVNDQQRVLPERHVGHLQFRGPSSMQGYYHRPDATHAIYHDGWLDSGDLAYQAEGELYVTGRAKDLIIKAGRNIYPAEIEEYAGQVSGVRQGCVAAFGVGDALQGTEQLIVVAETREKDKAKRAAISEHIQEKLVSLMGVGADQVVLVGPHAVPKTSSGKLQRSRCKALFLARRLGHGMLPPWLQGVKLGLQTLLHQGMRLVRVSAKLFYTLYVAFVFMLLFPPFYLTVCFASPALAARVTRLAARSFIWLVGWRMKVIGKEHLTFSSPAIFASNHASYVDAAVLFALLPVGTRFTGKKELLQVPLIRTLMKKLNILSVDRLDLSKSLVDTENIEAVLREGRSILIFPEGTFGYTAGLRPFRLGAFKMAASTGLPVCPIALSGTREILRADNKLFWPGSITVTICPPVRAKGQEWQDVIQLRDAVHADIAAHCGEATLDFMTTQPVGTHRMEKHP